MWMDEAYFSLHNDINTQNSSIWVTSNPREYLTKPLYSPHVSVWCSFTASFILGPFFFSLEDPCPKFDRKTYTIVAERYLTFLCENIVSDLQERHVLPVALPCRIVPHSQFACVQSRHSCWTLSLKTNAKSRL